MNQKVDAAGKGVTYSGMIDCFVKTARTEGVLALWKGTIPSYLRVGPRVLVIFGMYVICAGSGREPRCFLYFLM